MNEENQSEEKPPEESAFEKTSFKKATFEKTNLNTIKRSPNLADYDQRTVHEVFDQAWVCHVGFVAEERAMVIPMYHVRVGNELVFHGATTSRLMKQLGSGSQICVSAAMVDGLVLARSLFKHSVNYRSAVAFGTGRLVSDEDEQWEMFKAISDRVMAGRWDDSRQPNELEKKATAIVAVEIESASAKVRTGGPNCDKDDCKLPVWAGVVPLKRVLGSLQPAENLDPNVAIPEYLSSFVQSYGREV